MYFLYRLATLLQQFTHLLSFSPSLALRQLKMLKIASTRKLCNFACEQSIKKVFNYRNNQILLKHAVINNTNITNEISSGLVEHFNVTSNGTWDFQICNLETMLSDVGEGTGLAFIIFTQAIVELPGSPFWAVLFFTMLLSLGLGSQIGILEGMLCTIFDIDIFKRVRKPYLTGFVCVFCFLVGLTFTTGAGEYWLKMFDSFAGTLGLVVVAFMEMIAVVYIYGHEKWVISNFFYPKNLAKDRLIGS